MLATVTWLQVHDCFTQQGLANAVAVDEVSCFLLVSIYPWQNITCITHLHNSDALVPNNACRAQGVFPVLASCYTQDLSSMSEHVTDGLLKGSSRDVR